MTMSLQQAMDHAAVQLQRPAPANWRPKGTPQDPEEVMAIGLPCIDALRAASELPSTCPSRWCPIFFGEGPEFLEAQFGVPWTLPGRCS